MNFVVDSVEAFILSECCIGLLMCVHMCMLNIDSNGGLLCI